MSRIDLISIRQGQPIDVQLIAEWQVAMAWESEKMRLDMDTVLRGVKHVFEQAGIGFYVIAAMENQPVGCALVLSEWSDWRAARVLWIHSVYVMPRYRKSRVFSSIYQYLKAMVASDKGLCGLRLYVDKKNSGAIAAYERLGMNRDHYDLYEWMK